MISVLEEVMSSGIQDWGSIPQYSTDNWGIPGFRLRW